MTGPAERARLAELARAATPGPWLWKEYISGAHGEYSKQSVFMRAPSVRIEPFEQQYGRLVLTYDRLFRPPDRSGLIRDDDAAYIAAADPTVILALLSDIAALEAVASAARAGPGREHADNWVRLAVALRALDGTEGQ